MTLLACRVITPGSCNNISYSASALHKQLVEDHKTHLYKGVGREGATAMCDNRAYTHRPSGPVAAPLRIPRGAFLCRYVEIDSVRQGEGDQGIKSGMYLLFQGWFMIRHFTS